MRWWWCRKHPLAGAARHRCGGTRLNKVIAAIKRCGFFPADYVCANPDLVQLPDADAAMMHFVAVGIDEERQFPINLDLDGFDELGALELAPDFKAAIAAVLVNNYLAPSSSFWGLCAGNQRAFLATLIPTLRRWASPYLIVGDSHSGLYRQLIVGARQPLLPVHVLMSACSAVGLSNPDSRSGAARRVVSLAEALPRDARPIFKFGQVDVEFVFAFKRIETGHHRFDPEAFDQFCRRFVFSYVDFLNDHFEHHNVAVASIFPPTLSDEAWREGYVNAHIAAAEGDHPLEAIRGGVKQLEIPTLVERTRHQLATTRSCVTAASGLAFIDDFSPFLGADGVDDPRFIPMTRGRDHHLERAPAAPIIKDIIARTILHGLKEINANTKQETRE